MRLLRFEVEIWLLLFQNKKRNHRWYLENKCCSLKQERRKRLVGGTERSLLLEELGLLFSDLLVDLGSLAGLVAVGSGLYNRLACCCVMMDEVFGVREG